MTHCVVFRGSGGTASCLFACVSHVSHSTSRAKQVFHVVTHNCHQLLLINYIVIVIIGEKDIYIYRLDNHITRQ